jgi:hypothetical protein
MMKRLFVIIVFGGLVGSVALGHVRDIYPPSNRDFYRPSTPIEHELLSTTHSDTAADSPTRGSLVYGNSDPGWGELVISSPLGATSIEFLGSDGTDVGYRTLDQMIDDMALDSRFVNITGDTMTGILNMGGNNIEDAGNFIPIDSTKSIGDASHVLDGVWLDGPIGVQGLPFSLTFDIGTSFDWAVNINDAVHNFDGLGAFTGTLTFETDNDLFILNTDTQIDGDLTVGDIALNVNSTTKTVGVGIASNENILLFAAKTGTVTASQTGLFFAPQYTMGAGALDITAMNLNPFITDSDFDIGNLYGIKSTLQTSAMDSITLDSACAFLSDMTLNTDSRNGATVTNAFHVRLNNPVASTHTVIGSLYGIYMEEMVRAGTTSWQIYSLGGNSAHVGNLRLGDTTVPTERLEVNGNVIVANGSGIIVGHDTKITDGVTPEFQVLGTSGADSCMFLGRWEAASSSPNLKFVKSRNATIGSHAIVEDNDKLGGVKWYPDDGVDFATMAADICVEVDDASPAAGDVGTAFVWRQMPGGGGAIAETMRLNAAGLLTVPGGAVIGTGGNETQVSATGDISQAGTARRTWAKYTADSVTTTNGSPTGTVADLQTAHDGNFYLVTEDAGGGFDTVVDFVSVTAFNYVRSSACYKGNGSHAVAVQLYNWTQTRWDSFDALHDEICDVTTVDGYVLDNTDFNVPDDTEYIGTGGNAGQVRVTYRHTPLSVANHTMNIDVCALYQ